MKKLIISLIVILALLLIVIAQDLPVQEETKEGILLLSFAPHITPRPWEEISQIHSFKPPYTSTLPLCADGYNYLAFMFTQRHFQCTETSTSPLPTPPEPTSVQWAGPTPTSAPAWLQRLLGS